MMTISRAVVLIAMDEEARPLLDSLGLIEHGNQLEPPLPMMEYTSSMDGLEAIFVTNGVDPRFHASNVGTQPATLAAFCALKKHKPDVLLNSGTAGGLRQMGAGIGDRFVSGGPFSFHDRRIDIPRYSDYAIGNYLSVDVSTMADELDLKVGRISTGNSLDCTPRDLEIIQERRCPVKDMEAAAIAWVASLFNTPLIALKVVTDLVDDTEAVGSQFAKHLESAAEIIAETTVAALRYIRQSVVAQTADGVFRIE